MRKIILLFTVCMLFSTPAFAHVMNKNNTFEDLTLTDAADEIVMLSALGIVSALDNQSTFKPTETLTAQDLAAWVAAYHGLTGETSEQLASAALEEQLVSTIDGAATYQLVNEAFFNGQLTVEHATATMTRDVFAQFMFEQLETQVDGQSVIEAAGFTPGPIGKIEQVTKNEATSTYVLTIDGQQYEMGMHPRAIADSADPTVWVGETVVQAWVGPDTSTDHHAHATHEEETKSVLQVVVIGEEPLIGEQEVVAETTTAEELAAALDEVEAEKEEPTQANTWLYIVGAAIVLILASVVVKRKK